MPPLSLFTLSDCPLAHWYPAKALTLFVREQKNWGMLFTTNRFPQESLRTRNGRRFTFDLKNNSESKSVFFGNRIVDGEYEEIGCLELLRRLKGCEYRQILVFSNMPEDVVNESLELGKEGMLVSHASRNVIVYHASDDLALRASKAANLKNKVASRRLGHTGTENMDRVSQNVYSVDCDDVNTQYDPPTGHSYFRSDPSSGNSGKVFQHILDTLITGRVYPEDKFRRTSILKNTK